MALLYQIQFYFFQTWYIHYSRLITEYVCVQVDPAQKSTPKILMCNSDLGLYLQDMTDPPPHLKSSSTFPELLYGGRNYGIWNSSEDTFLLQHFSRKWVKQAKQTLTNLTDPLNYVTDIIISSTLNKLTKHE